MYFWHRDLLPWIGARLPFRYELSDRFLHHFRGFGVGSECSPASSPSSSLVSCPISKSLEVR